MWMRKNANFLAKIAPLPHMQHATVTAFVFLFSDYTAQATDFATQTPSCRTQAGSIYIGDKRMATGTVKWFNSEKGYGFIAPETGGNDVFVHITAVQQAGLDGLKDNQKINYEVEAGRNGREAATTLQLL